ncbi:MAG: HTH domain-containing protein, partial [Iodobacter sp.]
MVHFPYPRLALLFDALQGEPLPQDELARMLEVSSRPVRTDIGLLNDILSGHGARFVLRRGEGYQLQLDDPERYHQMLAS